MHELMTDDYIQYLAAEFLGGERGRGVRFFLFLNNIEFDPWFPNDINRAKDGVALRDDFADYFGDVRGWRHLYAPCSFLEMVLALARRAAFEADDLTADIWTQEAWTQHLLRNAGLDPFNPPPDDEIFRIVRMINNREYRPNGEGGLFPLRRRHVSFDARNAELWMQLAAYIVENTALLD